MGVKISQMPAVSAIAGTEQIEANDGGTSKRATQARIKTWVQNNVTDLATAKTALAALACAVAWLARGNEG